MTKKYVIMINEVFVQTLAKFLTNIRQAFTLATTSVLLSRIVRPRLTIPFPLAHRSDVVKATKSWEFYLSRAKARLTKAYLLLNEGKEDEAGEEAWRATVDALNAISVALWNHEIRSHNGLSKLVEELYRLKIVDVTVEYGNATTLHKNFYHIHLGPQVVKACINKVKELIDKIEYTIISLTEDIKAPPWSTIPHNVSHALSNLLPKIEPKSITPRIRIPIPQLKLE